MKMEGIGRVICTGVPWNECHSCGRRVTPAATECYYRLVPLGGTLSRVIENSRHVHINEMQFGKQGFFFCVCVCISYIGILSEI